MKRDSSGHKGDRALCFFQMTEGGAFWPEKKTVEEEPR
jgi:hypothetical protein